MAVPITQGQEHHAKDSVQVTEPPTPGKGVTPRTRKPPRPNYTRIHAKPLPLDVIPLPAFVPHNPLSLFRILSALISEAISRPTSHPDSPYVGYFSPETRSIHVTDTSHVRALWEMGFFGKGSLSRSEPSWLDREKARRKSGKGGTSEEATSKRREERRMFKLERARAEREVIEEQLRKEGKLAVLQPESSTTTKADKKEDNRPNDDVVSLTSLTDDKTQRNVEQLSVTFNSTRQAGFGVPGQSDTLTTDDLDEDAPLTDQEHLQLNLCEAMFLAYGLGVLTVIHAPQSPAQGHRGKALSTSSLLTTFACHSLYPPCRTDQIRPDNPFLLQYVVYHHYRSLGWVVRPGAKFAVDWLLYNRGPVFSHAEFAVIVIPEYPDGYSSREQSSSDQKATAQQVAQKRWWEFHCTNRVQSQVRKTLVLCYVEVPTKLDLDTHDHKVLSSGNNSGIKTKGNVGKSLKGYRVRDFVVRRWLANRSRD
ncbi:tRNA intron endonuclease-like protein [Elsinoe fawcettii]|nr:tRNA intron endonuclease-like protein [Elsinoe fawcettii]